MKKNVVKLTKDGRGLNVNAEDVDALLKAGWKRAGDGLKAPDAPAPVVTPGPDAPEAPTKASRSRRKA